MGLTTSCLWDLQRGECVPFPWEQGWELKASGFAKVQEEVWREFPGLLAGCLPPSAHLLLSQIFSPFLLPPPLLLVC